ncbi:MAG: adenylate/guanylate cyclase domain-containing protein [Saezia sp.]
MTPKKKTIIFVDLSGSTTIFEELGDERATQLVYKAIHDIASHLGGCGGRVLKLLGDGVMILFDTPEEAISACNYLDDVLVDVEESVPQNLLGTDRISVRVGVDYGTLVEYDNDVYGDIVNVASRILSHARPGELMMTTAVYQQLSIEQQKNCRHIGSIHLRGKSLPQIIYGMNLSGEDPYDGSGDHAQETVIASLKKSVWGDMDSEAHIVFTYQGKSHYFSSEQLPIIIGRSLESDLVVPDARVSRSHVRIDWFASQFYLTDISINGTMVQYGGNEIGDPLPVSMRRQRCTLIRTGYILLGVLDREMLAKKDNEQLPPALYFKVEEKELEI